MAAMSHPLATAALDVAAGPVRDSSANRSGALSEHRCLSPQATNLLPRTPPVSAPRHRPWRIDVIQRSSLEITRRVICQNFASRPLRLGCLRSQFRNLRPGSSHQLLVSIRVAAEAQPPSGASVRSTHVRLASAGSLAASAAMSVSCLTTASCLPRSSASPWSRCPASAPPHRSPANPRDSPAAPQRPSGPAAHATLLGSFPIDVPRLHLPLNR